MSNPTSFAGWYNLPAQVISGTTETSLLVPAQGLYPGVPSPTLAAAAGLFLAVTPDITGSQAVDGRALHLRIAGVIKPGASTSFTPKLYLGTNSTIASNTTIVSLTAYAATTGNYNFLIEASLLWDAVSQKLSGKIDSLGNGVYQTVNSFAQLTGITNIASLAFIPSFTFSTGNAANTVIVNEFALDRD